MVGDLAACEWSEPRLQRHRWLHVAGSPRRLAEEDDFLHRIRRRDGIDARRDVKSLAAIAVARYRNQQLGRDLAQPVDGAGRAEIRRTGRPDRPDGGRGQIEHDGFEVVGDNARNAISRTNTFSPQRLHAARHQPAEFPARHCPARAVFTTGDQRQPLVGFAQQVLGIVQPRLGEKPLGAQIGPRNEAAPALVADDADKVPELAVIGLGLGDGPGEEPGIVGGREAGPGGKAGERTLRNPLRSRLPKNLSHTTPHVSIPATPSLQRVVPPPARATLVLRRSVFQRY